LTPDPESTSEEEGLLMQKKLMDDVSEARPLAKLQEQLEERDASAASGDSERAEAEPDGAVVENGKSSGQDTEPDGGSPVDAPPAPPSRKPLLNNVDNELDRLSRVR
jgi:RNA polymerase II subunit A-like phosphatase